MPMQNKNVPVLLLWLLPLLMVSGCANKSLNTPPPVVGEKPIAQPLPSSVAGIEPPPSGTYWARLTDWRKRSQELLNSTPMKSAP